MQQDAQETRIQPIAIKAPQLDLDADAYPFPVIISPKLSYYKQWNTSSYGNNNIHFTMPPNDSQTVIDRRMFIYVPFRVTFRATATVVGQSILTQGQDAPRQFPFNSCCSSAKLSLNGMSFTVEPAEIVHAFLTHNNPEELEQGFHSMGFSYPDQSASYAPTVGAFGTNRNPLGGYGEVGSNHAQSPRGAGNWTVLANPVSTAIGEVLTAVVEFFTVEPLFFLHPLLAGMKEDKGLYSVNTMELNFQMLTQQQRIWSRVGSTDTAFENSLVISYDIGRNITSLSQKEPLMFANYYTLNEQYNLPRNINLSYPYYAINILANSSAGLVAPLNQIQLTSNSIQLATIPKAVYIFVREQSSDLFQNPRACDFYLSLKNVSINFQNQNGILADASPQQLYAISRKNGCSQSWIQWGGDRAYVATFASQCTMRGGPLCLQFGQDIPLQGEWQSPAQGNQSTFQVKVTALNQSNRNINAVLYVVPVYEGVFNLRENYGNTQINLLTEKDVKEAKKSRALVYDQTQHVTGAGFFDDVVDFLKRHKVISNVMKIFPLTAPFSGIAENFGFSNFGDEEEDLDIEYQGGRQMPKRALKKHAKKRIMM
jgi:hypothetical protein